MRQRVVDNNNLRCAIQTPKREKIELEEEEAKTLNKRIGRKSRTVNIALIGLIAGVYAVATIALGTFSYGPINLRFTNILLAIVPIVGWPSVAGLTLGVLISNTASSIGPIDYISAFFSFVGLLAIYVLRKKSVLAGLTIYSILLSLWVTFEL